MSLRRKLSLASILFILLQLNRILAGQGPAPDLVLIHALVEESDRVLRVVRLLSQAETVYGSRERALEWLRHPLARLKNRVPLDLMRTDTGARILEELLVQIDEGMFV